MSRDYVNNYKDYKPPFLLFNGHLQTIYPGLLRKVNVTGSQLGKIETSDEDFLEYDHYKVESDKVVIISHGLEGNSRRPYVLGMVRDLLESGFDIIAWNYRGCSNELNKKPMLYHSGATYDLKTMVEFASQTYSSIYLVGFSLGGNLTLKFLGEEILNPSIKKAVCFSVPLDLKSGALNISSPGNRIYENRFLRSLSRKIRLKNKQFPHIFKLRHLDSLKSLYQFDDLYTAPIHGFQNAEDYYAKSSSINFLPEIKIPTLIVNALNDPLLPASCLDPASTAGNTWITFELPEMGGHCGFPKFNSKSYWSEIRCREFFKEN